MRSKRKNPKIKFSIFIGGVVSLLFGFLHLVLPFYWNTYFTRSKEDKDNWFAAGEIIVGLVLLFIAWRWRFDPGDDEFICPECESLLARKELKVSDGAYRCPHDGSPMEPLEGYYDRHPERREGPVTPNQ
jgi:hypothetical protein